MNPSDNNNSHNNTPSDPVTGVPSLTPQPEASWWQRFADDVMARLRRVKKTRWWRFGIVAFIYLLWVIWMNNYWLLLGLLLLVDIYLTGYIPFTWWKKSKKKWVRVVMGWVDAIVYALVLVYFIFNFVGQNYQIPSSSLEKTLLTGDYLWVNKLAYGPRVPMTPIHLPLVHNTIPFLNIKSYTDWPELEYHRLPGYRSVERGDIVVFNFPAGDTVALQAPNAIDYYTLVKQYGWRDVNINERFGEVIYRPVDRRENYVKRAVGLPGERLKIVDDRIYINGKAIDQPKNVQFNYLFQLSGPLNEDICHDLGVALEDVKPFNPAKIEGGAEKWIENMRQNGFLPDADIRSYYYQMPASSDIIRGLRKNGMLKDYIKINDLPMDGNATAEYLFPSETAVKYDWTLSNYGGEDGILIPKKGMKINLTPYTWDLYNRVIRNYERHTNSYIKDEQVYIDGKAADTYTFQMDYYFMMGDNRDNSLDSRFWGFVPEDHIVGTPLFVLISFDKDRSIFNGGIRWSRIFKDANPDD